MLTFLVMSGGFFSVNAQTMCDTINSPIPANWTATTYAYNTPFPGVINGYISGVNSQNYSQQANYFDLSATTNNYILGLLIKFSKANSNVSANLSKNIIFRVYNDDAGKPGTEITTASTIAQTSLSNIKSNVDAGITTAINFPSAIALPASKKFYVTVDVSNFQWYTPENIRDSVCIATTADNQTVNTAWGFDSGALKWKSYTKDWDTPPDYLEPLDVTLYIFPYVSNVASGCALLPVQLLSFNAERKAADVQLKWQVSNEINMKGYEIEKAANNGIYKTVGFVAAVNSLKNQQYTLTDRNAFVASATAQYRVKQIDNDGSVKYSRIISLSANNSLTDVVFANPFTGSLKLQLNLSEAQTVSVKMYDMEGRTVVAQNPLLYSASANLINVSASENLKPGAYLLEINTATEHKVYKVIKQ